MEWLVANARKGWQLDPYVNTGNVPIDALAETPSAHQDMQLGKSRAVGPSGMEATFALHSERKAHMVLCYGVVERPISS